MLPTWRRIRLITTITFSILGIGLLVLAYSLIGRFPGSTVVTLAMFAIVIPVGMYGLFTVTGWHRSAASAAKPNPLVGWIIRNGLAPFLPILFMVFLFGLGRGMDLTPLDRSGSAANTLNDSCMAGARQEITRNGRDPADPVLKAKAISYCTCVTAGVQREYEPEEFARLSADADRLEHDPKMGRLMESCVKQAGG